jgi:hypothetical protein
MSNAATALGPAAKPMTLRICGGPRDGQLVHLGSRKCTIGAADDCTLRLRARGTRPVHCLILRGPRETLIRRWSADTLLNGRTFTDAILNPGDRVRCGPVEFEWVEQPPVEEDEKEEEEVDMRSVTQVIERPAQPNRSSQDDDRRILEQDRQALEAEKRQWRLERRREEESLQQQRDQVESLLAKQLAKAKAIDPAPHSSQDFHLSEKAMKQDVSGVLTQPLPATPASDKARVVELEQELARICDQLDQLREEFDHKQTSFDSQLAALQQTTADEAQSFAARSAELDRQTLELQAAQNRIDAEFARLQQAQTDLIAREQAFAAEQNAAQEVWNARIDQLELREAELTRRESDLASAESSHDDASPSYTRQFATVPDQDSSDDEDQADSAADSMPRIGTTAIHASPDDEEQAIEQYMNALLHRVGGHSAATAPVVTTTSMPAPAVLAPQDTPDETTESTPTETAANPRVTRKAAPENTGTMAAMREIANLNTRVALDRHGKTRLLASAWLKATVAASAFATSIWLAHSPTTPTILGPYGVWIAFIIGAVYALMFGRTMRERTYAKKSIQSLLAQTASTLEPTPETPTV